MSKLLYVKIGYAVTEYEPPNWNALWQTPLVYNGKSVWSSSASIGRDQTETDIFGPPSDSGYDYAILSIAGMTLIKPADYGTDFLLGTTKRTLWTQIYVDDGFVVPAEYDIASAGKLIPAADGNSFGISKATLNLSADVIGSYTIGGFTASTQDNVWSLAEKTASVLGLNGLATALGNASVLKNAVEKVVSDGVGLVTYGMQNFESLDPYAYNATVNSFLKSANDVATQALVDVTLFPGNESAEAAADAILGGIRMVGIAQRDGITSLPLGSVEVGLKVEVGGFSLKTSVTGTASADVVLTGNTPTVVEAGAGNDAVIGGNSSDTFYGGDGADYLHGGNGNDVLYSGGDYGNFLNGGDGNDVLVDGMKTTVGFYGTEHYGGAGLDTLKFNLNRSEVEIFRYAGVSAQYLYRVDPREGSQTSTIGGDIERVEYLDTKFAFDLAGSAGLAVKTLGVIFGKAAVASKEYVGLALDVFDQGFSYDDVLAGALQIKLGPNPTTGSIVDLLYANLAGFRPQPFERAYWVNQLDSGALSLGSLLRGAADSELNSMNINLTGLAVQGVEYF